MKVELKQYDGGTMVSSDNSIIEAGGFSGFFN